MTSVGGKKPEIMSCFKVSLSENPVKEAALASSITCRLQPPLVFVQVANAPSIFSVKVGFYYFNVSSSLSIAW